MGMSGFNMGGFGSRARSMGMGMNMNSYGNGGGGMSMGGGMGVSGMSDYTSDFDGFRNPAGNMPGGSRMSDLTPSEREFLGGGGSLMGGAGFGRGGARNMGASGNAGGLIADAAMQGRRIKVEGLKGLSSELTDEMVCRYFRKFGVVDDWKRDKSGDTGYIEFTESYMVEYCLKRPSHIVDGNELQVTKAEPKFDDNETQDADQEDQDADQEAQEADAEAEA